MGEASMFFDRLKLNTGDDTEESEMEDYITPSTPILHPGTLGAVEPSMTQTTIELNIPLTEYKWNQIVEIQLPDGKKVRIASSLEGSSIECQCF